MEQGEPSSQVFIDDGIGGAGDPHGNAQATGQTTGKGGFSRTQISPIGDDFAALQVPTEGFADGFRFFGTGCSENHAVPLFFDL